MEFRVNGVLVFIIPVFYRITAKPASYRLSFAPFSKIFKKSRLNLCRKINIVRRESIFFPIGDLGEIRVNFRVATDYKRSVAIARTCVLRRPTQDMVDT